MSDNDVVTAAEPDSMPETDPAGASSDEQTTPARPRRLWLFVVIALVVVALDVITKALVVAKLTNHAPVRLIGGAIFLVETRNSGAAFSVGTGATLVLTVVALIVVVVIARAARRMRSIVWSIALGLIFGGAVGNLIDRIFRAPGVGRGHVVDWISLFSDDGHPWPIFNLADSAIVCGAITAALVAIIGIDVDGTRRR